MEAHFEYLRFKINFNDILQAQFEPLLLFAFLSQKFNKIWNFNSASDSHLEMHEIHFRCTLPTCESAIWI